MTERVADGHQSPHPRPARSPTTSSALPARCARPAFRSGPGAVIDALNALQVIEIGNRADVFTTLEAIFVKRHEHALIFAQAFDLFFRAAEDWKHMLDSVPLPDHARKKPPPASRRVQEALSQPSMREEPQAQEQELQAVGLRQGSAAEKGFCADERGRNRGGDARHREDAAAAGRVANPPLPAGCAGPAARYAPHPAQQPSHRRRDHRYPQARPDREAGADRGAARYIGIDERIYPPVSCTSSMPSPTPASASRCSCSAPG